MPMRAAGGPREGVRGDAVPAVVVRAPVADAYAEILSAGALEFLTGLHQAFDGARRALLRTRAAVQRAIDEGDMPEFPADTSSLRAAAWTAAPVPVELVDRRVEITTPVDRKALITALNSGANVCVADFDNSTSPTWSNLIEGQANLRDAVGGAITYTSSAGLLHRMNPATAHLCVRPRGWPLDERRVIVDQRPISAALFDLGLFLFHNTAPLLQRGSTPHVQLARVQSRQEARWLSDVLAFAEDHLGWSQGTVRATVLVDHVLGMFELEEIVWELKDRVAGLAWSRWDYLHSFVPTFRNRPELVLPQRSQLTVARHFLRSGTDLVVRTAHRREVHALTGVVAQLPIKEHSAAHRGAMRQVRADLSRDAQAGFDGVCVSHPDLVPIAREIFDLRVEGPHQVRRKRDDAVVTAEDLLALPACIITEEGLRQTLGVALEYLEAWLRGTGRVAVDHCAEDAASAELAAAHLWQWVKHGARLDDGRRITAGLLDDLIAAELAERSERHGSAAFESSRFLNAADLLADLVREHELPDGLCAAARPYLR